MLTVSADGSLFATIAHQQAGPVDRRPEGQNGSPYVSVFQVFESRQGTARTQAITVHGVVKIGLNAGAVFSGNNRYLITAIDAYDATLSIWDIAMAKRVSSVALPEKGVDRVASSYDGAVVAYETGQGSLFVWRWKAGESPRKLGRANGLNFEPGTDRLAFLDGEAVWRWDLARADRPTVAFKISGEELRKLAFHPTGKFVAVQQASPARVWVWETATKELVARIDQLPADGSLAFDASGGYLTKVFNFQTVRAPLSMAALVAEARQRLCDVAGRPGPQGQRRGAQSDRCDETVQAGG